MGWGGGGYYITPRNIRELQLSPEISKNPGKSVPINFLRSKVSKTDFSYPQLYLRRTFPLSIFAIVFHHFPYFRPLFAFVRKQILKKKRIIPSTLKNDLLSGNALRFSLFFSSNRCIVLVENTTYFNYRRITL